MWRTVVLGVLAFRGEEGCHRSRFFVVPFGDRFVDHIAFEHHCAPCAGRSVAYNISCADLVRVRCNPRCSSTHTRARENELTRGERQKRGERATTQALTNQTDRTSLASSYLPRGFRPCFVRRPIGRVARIVHCTRAGARCCQGSRNVCSRGKRKGELRTTQHERCFSGG